MRALITGITGFVGSHLADYLLARGDVELFGIKRWRSRTENIDHLQGRITLFDGDVRDPGSIRRILAEVRPERIFHLAAQSFVSTSWEIPAETLANNIQGQVNLFEAVRELSPTSRIHIAGSSEEYGLVAPEELPIVETTPLRPLSPYAVSKVAQDLLAYQYWMSYQLPVVRTRGFNHSGPRRGDVFVTSNFARQIAEVERGRREPIVWVGNLAAVRDFTDVRDMVRAYWLALERGSLGEVYNVCSGRGYAVREILDLLLGMTSLSIEVREDPRRLRPSDVPALVGDCKKFKQVTGWEPTIPFEVTLKDLLEYWRDRV